MRICVCKCMCIYIYIHIYIYISGCSACTLRDSSKDSGSESSCCPVSSISVLLLLLPRSERGLRQMAGVRMIMIVYPRETPPHIRTARASPQRHTAAGTAAPTTADTGNTVPQRANPTQSVFRFVFRG